MYCARCSLRLGNLGSFVQISFNHMEREDAREMAEMKGFDICAGMGVVYRVPTIALPC